MSLQIMNVISDPKKAPDKFSTANARPVVLWISVQGTYKHGHFVRPEVKGEIHNGMLRGDRALTSDKYSRRVSQKFIDNCNRRKLSHL